MERASRRKKVKDAKNYDAIDRIEQLGSAERILCHRKCHSEFIHPKSIKALETKASVLEDIPRLNTDAKQLPSSSLTPRSSRKSFSPVDWELCMFCQKQNRQKLFNITTFSVSDMVLQNAKYDQTLRVKLGNVSDLIAAEGKYHLKCMNAFKYETQKTEKESKGEDLAMIFLVRELEYAGNKHQILQLSDVWSRYCRLIEEIGSEIPQSYITRKSTFKDKLQIKVQGIF